MLEQSSGFFRPRGRRRNLHDFVAAELLRGKLDLLITIGRMSKFAIVELHER
jgi:hypothetical protein